VTTVHCRAKGESCLQTSCSSAKTFSRLVRVLATLTAFLFALSPSLTETAVANGDTRTIYLHHAHTGEDIAATYLVNGQYDSNVLKQLNWFLRDWRRDEPTNMDPRLFDVVWEAYRGAGAGNQVINVVSAYRSPETNAMLRSRSRAVAKYSQHMLGKAMDTTMPGMPMSHIREIGMRMQRGGVGYYPTANTPFVHLDVGNVRSWPRMSYDQLVRLFPDGKTVHLPTNGQPLPGYEQARAEIEARGDGAFVTAPRKKSRRQRPARANSGRWRRASDAAQPTTPTGAKKAAAKPPTPVRKPKSPAHKPICREAKPRSLRPARRQPPMSPRRNRVARPRPRQAPKQVMHANSCVRPCRHVVARRRWRPLRTMMKLNRLQRAPRKRQTPP